MTPAAVIAACDARQRQVEAGHGSLDFDDGKDAARDLAVVALVRGVAERHGLFGLKCFTCGTRHPMP